jgi:dTDP-4-dehydrorhamnose reductase
MKILITGAGGFLGQALAAEFKSHYEIRALDHHQLDITDAAAVGAAMRDFAPDLVLNCAAAARVDLCESDEKTAYAVNGHAPGLLAAAAQELDAEIMHISTDYVFDGEKRAPYTIADAPRPLSIYGRSKLAGECAAQAANAKHYIVRVARLFGAGGKNFGSAIFDHLRRAANAGEQLKVFNYPISQATYLPDLAMRLREIIARGAHGTYHVTNSGDIVSWYEFAICAARMLGLSETIIELATYQEMGLPAPRPQYSGLRCLLSEQLGLTPLPDWRVRLAEILAVAKE